MQNMNNAKETTKDHLVSPRRRGIKTWRQKQEVVEVILKTAERFHGYPKTK